MMIKLMSSEKLKVIYLKKIDLLANGLKISEIFYESIKKFGVVFSKGRMGGAGPAGGRYFLFENESLVNVPLLGSKSEKSYLVLREIVREDPNKKGYYYCRILNEKTGESYDDLRLVPSPDEYNTTENEGGLLNKQIALVHGTSCLASTIVQKCKHWREGKQCQFCGIELNLKNGKTTKWKTAEQLIDAIESAKNYDLCDHITLTAGTLDTEDKGAENYIEVVSKIKNKFPDLPVHIQIEAFMDDTLLKRMKEVGVDTIGIHLEIPDDDLRKKYCPGKAETPREVFEDLWKKGVEIFGKGQVSTFILIGFDENIDKLIEYIDKIISWGVVPNIMPVRQILNTNLDVKLTNYEDMQRINSAAAESFIRHGLNPLKNKAGCIRCSGCSAINDAYKYYSEIKN